MATIKKTNIYAYLKSKFSNTASHIKMNGTQSAGSSDLMARADHVHPTDTSRAPNNHASSATTYGVSSASNYGHSMASGTTPKVDGTAAVGSETAKFARGDHVHPSDTSRAPTSHASSATTYGVGSASNYGHVKVDSSPTDSSSNAVASGGVKTVLDTKQNEVETQSKIVGFTNKDRINIERLLNYMNHASPYQYANYYTLDIECAGIYNLMETPGTDNANIRQTYSGHQPIPMPAVFSENDKLATVTKTNMENYEYSQKLLFCATISKDTAEQTSNKTAITFKLIDGTVLGTSTVKLSSDYDANGPLSYYTYLCLDNTWEAGIYYVYAEATLGGSVVRSPILSVFVKDTNNLVDYNCWSGTDYNNNTTQFSFLGTTGTPSNEWSYTGENSLKISTTQAAQAFDIQHLTVDSGKTVTISFAMYNPSIQVRAAIRTNTGALTTVSIPASSEVKRVTVSANVVESYDWVTLRCFLDQVGYCFIDDITFNVS